MRNPDLAHLPLLRVAARLWRAAATGPANCLRPLTALVALPLTLALAAAACGSVTPAATRHQIAAPARQSTAATPAPGPHRVVGTCDIILNPTKEHHTTCLGAELRNADLANLDLSYADLAGANLDYADLTKAKLVHTNLEKAALIHADLSDADLDHANLQHGNAASANLSSADLYATELNGAYLAAANLSGADLQWADFESANLNQANLVNTQFSHTHFCNTTMPWGTSNNNDC